MSLVALAIAAVLLAAERACYVVIARRPDLFLALYARFDPKRTSSAVTVVERLFFAFKGLQFGVFIAWCYIHSGRFPFPAPHGPFVMALSWALAVAGQVLVVSTFYRLGRPGVFFGDQLGYAVPRCRTFPFSLLAHPQYVGTLLTIWGGFMLVRFPHDDWWALPLLETVYYLGGMWLETPRRRYGARYASMTFRMRSRAARLTEGSERSRPT
jgi:phosphatidyl-N-methylethanolamine N-methyltransferase